MKRIWPFIKNKYLLSTLFVLSYILILHDTDILTLMNRKEKVTNLQTEIERKKKGIEDLKVSLEELDDIRSLEKYAREEHYFKKDDEDLFIFSFE
ncbi:MAG: septum formation initiator family protein [Flavobacteriales bacterium]|nr:septum formation initiator family protein [Flavobacteriales bacterium]